MTSEYVHILNLPNGALHLKAQLKNKDDMSIVPPSLKMLGRSPAAPVTTICVSVIAVSPRPDD